MKKKHRARVPDFSRPMRPERQVREESLESAASVLPTTPDLLTPSTAVPVQVPSVRPEQARVKVRQLPGWPQSASALLMVVLHGY